MEQGILYIATGEDYIEETKYSAASVREHMPDIPVALATDHEIINSDIFDIIIRLDDLYEDYGAGTIPADLSPFEKTLRLDTDTYLCDSIDEVFDILQEFDVTLTYSPAQRRVPGIPEPWVEYNGGVIGYSSTNEAKRFLTLWNELYEEWREKHNQPNNQPSLTKSLYKSDVRFFTLPKEYNCRVPRFGYIANDAKIVHGRHKNTELAEMAEFINSKDSRRVIWPSESVFSRQPIDIFSRKDWNLTTRGIAYRVRCSLRNDGVVTTTKDCIKEIYKLIK
jgi:hypothetical protein